MKKAYLFLLFLLCLMHLEMYAQKKTITGKVTSVNLDPIPGVTVVEEGTTNGTISGGDGSYSLSVSENTKHLLFSFVGMESQQVALGDKQVINVQLKEENITLNEVVAIGYGTVKKSDLTGSMSRVKVNDIEQRNVGTAEQLLQGTTPGIKVTTVGGAPGSDVDITIRGGNSLNASNAPLFIIDGLEMNSASSFYSSTEPSGSTPSPSPLSMVNPNDIESIDVLKDASATAIYGSRGANGVIIITTKKGKAGQCTIQFDYGSSVSSLRKKIDVINSKQWTQLYDEAAVNDGMLPVYGNPNDLSTYDIYTKNVNWQDQMYRTAAGRDVNLAIRGGKKDIKYSFSGNFNDAEGVIINSDQRRISLRSNIDVKANNFLSIGMDTYFSNTMSNIVPYSNKGSNGFFSPIMMAVQFRAFDKAWNSDFDTNLDELVNDGSAPYNPVSQIRNTIDEQRLNFAQSNLYAIVEITDWLKFKSSVGFNYSDGLRNSFWGKGTLQGDFQNNIVIRAQKSNVDYINENTLSFDKTLNKKHYINGVIGETMHKWIMKNFVARASDFDITSLGYESFTGAGIVETPDATHIEWGLASFYGRLNYSFDDRYLVTFTGRYDGSSKFAEGNKWAFFPSGAFAWKINKEDFMKDIKSISELKMRLSYGASGSQAIEVLSTIATLNRGSRYPVNGEFLPGVSSSTYLFNKDLKWETTYQANLGFDLGLFDNRLSITADYYSKKTKDLLLNKNFPISGGFTSTTINGGEVQNRGWELYVGGDIIRKNKTRWNMGISMSQNRSKIIDLDGAEFMYGSEIGGIQGGYPNVSYLNGTVGLFYGYQTNGIYQNADQVVGAPTKSGIAPKPGDIVYVDQLTPVTNADGTVTMAQDGVINDKDKMVIGNPEPDLILGLTSSFDYNNFSFSMVLNGMIGNDFLNLNNLVWEGMNIWDGRYSQTLDAFQGRWTPQNGQATHSRPSLKQLDQNYHDRYVEDGSFLRLQNISISYKWTPTGKSVISSVKPYISASNLFVLSNYSGYDPEIKGINSTLSPGIDLGAYPIPRTFKFGISIIIK